jgi:energy-converting hydrogenase Eha subunit A
LEQRKFFMIEVVLISIVVLAVLILATVAVLRKLGPADRSLPVTAGWIDELSTDRYLPMLRLLDSNDIVFLRSQAGYTAKMESKLRAQRCQVLRGYLRCLDKDFKQVCMALKLVLVQSQHDRPDLSAVLLHHQVMFATGMTAVYFRLFLYRWGICSVDVTALVQIFDVMRLELRNLVPTALPVGA